MVLVAPRSAKLVAARAHGSRCSRATCSSCSAFIGMFLLWKEDIAVLADRDPVRLHRHRRRPRGTPASNSLTGSVPVRRVGMASGTADLQRDLGGALMHVHLRRAADRPLRVRAGRPAPSSTSGLERDRRPSYEPRSRAPGTSPPQVLRTRTRSSRRRSRLSFRVTSGPTLRASSRWSSAPCSSSSCSRSSSGARAAHLVPRRGHGGSADRSVDGHD